MRILEVSLSGGVGHRHMGPVTSVITQLAREFAAAGHSVTVADSRAMDERSRFPANVDLHELDVESSYQVIRRANGSRHRARSTLRRVHQRAVSLIRSGLLEAHDVVHAHQPAIAVALARQAPGRCVYTCHTPNWIDLARYRSAKGLLRRARLLWQEATAKHDLAAIRAADLTIALQPRLIETVSRLRPRQQHRIRVIPNGVDVAAWPLRSREEARAALRLDPDSFRLIFVGRLHPGKGVHTLLESVTRLSRDIPALEVDVIANLPARASNYVTSLHRTAEGLPVTFHGFISNRETRFHDLLAASDLCVVPSLIDNQPTVVMESLALGVPVLGTRVGGIPMMLDDAVGRLVRPGDANDLTEAVLALYRDPETLQGLRRQCREHVATRYSWSGVAARHLEEFAMLGGQPKPKES